MISITPYGHATEEDLAALQAAIGPIHPQVADFLRRSNGGKPPPNLYQVPGRRMHVGVQLFLGLGPVPDYADLMRVLRLSRVPSGMCPVALASCGNLVHVENATGEVFFWDHELEDEDDPRAALTLIASSLDAFIDGLGPAPPPPPLPPGTVVTWIDPKFWTMFPDAYKKKPE